MIWYILGSCPAVACVCPEIAWEVGGILEEPFAPSWRNLMVLLELHVASVCVSVCRQFPPFATCVWVLCAQGDKPLFRPQMNFNLKKWSFVSCSNLFGCGFLSECFFPSGRCVVVGGSCRMEEHSLLSDSPCSWRLRYPMSLFTDNVFISIFFMCN